MCLCGPFSLPSNLVFCSLSHLQSLQTTVVVSPQHISCIYVGAVIESDEMRVWLFGYSIAYVMLVHSIFAMLHIMSCTCTNHHTLAQTEFKLIHFIIGKTAKVKDVSRRPPCLTLSHRLLHAVRYSSRINRRFCEFREFEQRHAEFSGNNFFMPDASFRNDHFKKP